MPGPTSEVVPFDGFSRGEYGLAASWDVGWRLLRQKLYYAGFFTSRNVQRSLHGTLYPRSGLVDITPSGVPTGALTGFAWTDVPNKDMLFSVGATVYDFPSVAGGAATAYTGTFAITPTVPVAFVPSSGGIVYASVFGDKTYRIDQTARTVVPLARIRVTDGVLNSTPTVTSATAAFTSFDVGTTIAATGIPVGTTIDSVTNATTIVLSAPASATASGVTLDIGVAAGGKCLAAYANKLVVANISGHPNRLMFSGDDSNDPVSLSDWTRWPALNFLDVGDGWDINGLLPQRTALMIAKQRSWYLLTGTPGVNDVLRPMSQNGPWVQAPNQVAMSGDNVIWFVDFNKDTPTAFNGSTLVEEDVLSFNGGVYAFTGLPPTFAVARGYRNHDIFFGAVTTPGGSMNAALLRDGAWTFHTFSPPGGFNGAWAVGRDGHTAGLRMSNGGAGGVAAKFYGWVTNRDRPPISGQPLESIGDASNTPLAPTVTLPEYWVRAGEELSPRSVIVDFVRWNDGYGINNHFDVQVQALNTYGDAATPGGVGSVQTQAFDLAVTGSAGAPTPQRATFNFDPEMGNGWRVSFANLKGVEIKKVQVKVEQSPMRGT